MPRLLALLPLLMLAACATPREACVAGATRDQRVLEDLADRTRANIARGYALEERQDLSPRLTFCTVRTRSGRVREELCNRNVVTTRAVPVSIDIDAERATLASQERRLAELRGRTDAVIRSCAIAYPA